MSSDSNILPCLPPELEREVFEIAAVRHPETILALVLVAQRVLHWIEPLLYRTLVLTKTWPREKNALVPISDRASAKFTKYVRNIMDSYPAPCPSPLLSLCSSISKLALFQPEPAMLPVLDNMRVQHLSIVLRHLFGGEIDPGRPLFRGLTHLDLWDDFLDDLPIADLPALTHLCINNERESSFLLTMFENCDKLHVLVNMYWKQLDLERARQAPDLVDDPRFVLMALDSDEYMADWRVGANGGQDFWARADRFVAKRKRGEISPVSRCWIVDADFVD
ncbi:hypothetical protein C8J57DRAFT_1403088 [Mycena rebaudengoi]|nr:hypothetical protein C8J57DRAFT_1403088 [Mycena rebaudengoi]